MPTLACFISGMISELRTVAHSSRSVWVTKLHELQLLGHLSGLKAGLYGGVVENPPMSHLLQGTSCAMQLSSEHASVLQPAAKWHDMEQCPERPEFGVNPSHPSQQGKLLVFSSPLLGIGRELFCPSPQRGGEASRIFQQHVVFVVQASVQPDWTCPLSARPRCPWRHPQQRCSGRTAL